MAKLEERTRPYETLIRYSEDGIAGAHHQTISEILRDGAVINAQVGDPLSLAVADGQDGIKLADVLGDATVLALKENQSLKAELDAASNTLADTQTQLADANAKILLLQDMLTSHATTLEPAQEAAR